VRGEGAVEDEERLGSAGEVRWAKDWRAVAGRGRLGGEWLVIGEVGHRRHGVFVAWMGAGRLGRRGGDGNREARIGSWEGLRRGLSRHGEVRQNPVRMGKTGPDGHGRRGGDRSRTGEEWLTTIPDLAQAQFRRICAGRRN